MKKALVTGANGFVGRNLVHLLVEHEYKVFAVDCISKENFTDDRDVEYIFSDLSDVDSLAKKTGKCNVIFHLAWAGVSPELRSNINVQKANIDLSINVVELAKLSETPRIVFLGSTMEYCYNDAPICECSFPTPSNCYGSCKIAARFICSQLCRDYGIDFEYAIITSIYGFGREDNNVIYYCINQLMNHCSPDLSSCTQRWDFIHINDAVEALRLIAEKGTPFTCYAIGNGENQQLKYYISIISNQIDSSIPINYGAIKNKDGLTQNSDVDISKLIKDTGFKPCYSFVSGISEVIEFYRRR